MTHLKQTTAIIMCAAALGLSGAMSPHAKAQDAYRIGLGGDLSGSASGTYKPLAEGVRIYVEQLNASGGIAGHPIELLTRDSRGDPNQVVADLNFWDSEDVLAVAFASPSGTIGSYAQHSAKLGMPTLYTNACYPPSTPPSPAKEFFCPGANVLTESYLAVDLLFEIYNSDEPMKIGFLTTDIPGARGAAEKIMKPYAEEKGAEVVTVAVMPVSSSDATSIARSMVEEGVNAVLSYTISTHMLAGADALSKIEWDGQYLMMTSLPGTLTQIRDQLKSETVFGFDQFSLLSEGKPVHQKIEAAVEEYGFDYPAEDARWGWRNGIVLEAALRACGWPCSRDELIEAMSGLTVDNQDLIDLQGTPLVWTDTIHTSPEKAYRVYNYDPSTDALDVAIDWMTFEERDWGN